MRWIHPDRWRPLLLLLLVAGPLISSLAGASDWPAGSASVIPITGASNDLSGATWNPQSQSLWVSRQNRRVWEYAYSPDSASFELLKTLVLPSGIGSDIEACAQVNHSAVDELYTLAENQGRIARVVDLGGTPTVQQVWNLEDTNNGHALPPETDGAGPEGLEFVPDSDLLAAGFRFPNGDTFTGSVKGMGGLMFVGHQIDGRLHVFDINPTTSDDFVNHGSFLTSASEIAGLHFDRTSGLMYLWHNPSDDNSLEISTLSSAGAIGTIDTLELYDTGMPSGNLEGIAVVGRASCGKFGSADSERVLFLTSDGDSPYLRSFNSFPCDCTGAANEAEFDACAESGDLEAGCLCLDQDLDGDVDCDDFSPALSEQCNDEPECGNNVLEEGEDCDDGNLSPGDCCSATCEFETSGTACGDGGTECISQDFCDGAGQCADNGFVANGTSCGNSSDNECTSSDSCNGAGSCLDNHRPATTACGDDGTECISQDFCDGAGQCADNGFVANGTSCGNSSDNECTSSDSCNGAGSCLDNHRPATTACGDGGTECISQDLCDGEGQCADNGFVANGTSCGNSSDNECTSSDSCNGAGNCLDNHRPATTACGDGGTECISQDLCDGEGQCADNGFVANGTSCGNSSDNECTSSDSCNGAGSCLDNHRPATTACGDGGTECISQDLCDGEGQCADNGFVANGTNCGDPATTCSGQDSCNGSGACLDNHLAATTACSDSDECTVVDQCDGGGACEPGLALDCDDADVCTTDSCSAVSGCSSTPVLECSVPVPAGSPRTAGVIAALLLTTAIVALRWQHPRPTP